MAANTKNPLLKITIRVVPEDYAYLRARYGEGYQPAIREMLSALVSRMRAQDEAASR